MNQKRIKIKIFIYRKHFVVSSKDRYLENLKDVNFFDLMDNPKDGVYSAIYVEESGGSNYLEALIFRGVDFAKTY